ncbi:hypothetical protein [Herminiimonas contaminans]|uniref:Uncharacterized protein n=1 Tax=Herminiimonas contaminans TaxID=1111140 RepID=A0ABS0ETQ1_9BURK|nr:hypothetical protein [Herminiimonas contaminans]MBF8177227.1 hypothetical protein [Herminiimonas contaminans]
MENEKPKPTKPPVEWQIDVLFGLMEAHYCALSALIRTHPDPEAFEAHFDLQLSAAQAQMLGSDRSDLATAALVDHCAELKGHLKGHQTPDGVAHHAWRDLMSRLKPE